MEGETYVGILNARDNDTPSNELDWSISGGRDRNHFSLSSDGYLDFQVPKDYEAPDDAGRNRVYDLTVRVSDGTNSDTANVRVALENRNEDAPTAYAGEDQEDIEEGTTVTLRGSGSDPDAETALSYFWNQISGESVTLSSPTRARTTFTAPVGLAQDEVLRFTLRVTDGGGLFHEDEVQVTVVASWKQGVFDSSEDYKHLCANPGKAFDKAKTRQGTYVDENNWLRSWSHETYLWYDEITDVNPAAHATPDYFDLMKTEETTSSGQPKDRFHFLYSTAAWEQLKAGSRIGYGARFRILSASPPRKAVVLYTEPGSPAVTANLVRGTQIISIDGIDFINSTDENEIAKLNAALSPSVGDTHTFTVKDPGTSSQERSVTMTAKKVTEHPVQNVKVLTNSNEERVGYILFNGHIDSAKQPLVNAVNTLMGGDGIDDLVLDIRYNSGGGLSVAQLISSMIAGSTKDGQTFSKVVHNDKIKDVNFLFKRGFRINGKNVNAPSLGLSRVFVLTGSVRPSTCSASETIINGLRGVDIEVIQIGRTTCGKPHGFYPEDNCGTTYFTIQLELVNAKDSADYLDGFSPTCSVADDFDHELGNAQEDMLEAALYYQANNSCPSSGSARTRVGAAVVSPEEKSPSADSVSIERFEFPGLILD